MEEQPITYDDGRPNIIYNGVLRQMNDEEYAQWQADMANLPIEEGDS